MLSYLYRTPAEPSGLAWDVYGSTGQLIGSQTAPSTMRHAWAETFEIGPADDDNNRAHDARWDGWSGSLFLNPQKVAELS